MALSRVSLSALDDIKIERADHKLALKVLSNLRQADYDEVVASTGRQPEVLAFDLPFNSRVALLKDEPVALFGLGLDAEGAHPWLLCTPGIKTAPVGRFMVEYGRGLLAQWAARYGTLTNVVYTKNTAHIRFIKALGCTLGKTERRGPLLQHFTEFSYVPSNGSRRASSTS